MDRIGRAVVLNRFMKICSCSQWNENTFGRFADATVDHLAPIVDEWNAMPQASKDPYEELEIQDILRFETDVRAFEMALKNEE